MSNMGIWVSGPQGGEVPVTLNAMATMAAMSFCKQLGIHRLKTSIQIRFHKNIVVERGSTTEGLCDCIDKRTFIIDVALYSNWMSILAHELVHVKQFARGELNPQLTHWKKRNFSNAEYWDQPWEKEARRLQLKLVQSFEDGEFI